MNEKTVLVLYTVFSHVVSMRNQISELHKGIGVRGQKPSASHRFGNERFPLEVLSREATPNKMPSKMDETKLKEDFAI